MALSIKQLQSVVGYRQKRAVRNKLIYQRGFFDGLKYSGYLLADVDINSVDFTDLQREHIHSLTKKALDELV